MCVLCDYSYVYCSYLLILHIRILAMHVKEFISVTLLQWFKFWQQTIQYVSAPLWILVCIRVCVLFLFVLWSHAAVNVWKVWAVWALRVPVLKTSAYWSASPVSHLLDQILFIPSLLSVMICTTPPPMVQWSKKQHSRTILLSSHTSILSPSLSVDRVGTERESWRHRDRKIVNFKLFFTLLQFSFLH